MMRSLMLAVIVLSALGHACPPAMAQHVYYVSPTGDDSRAGDSPETAWRHLTPAISKLRSGDTLIVGEGFYAIDEKQPLARAFVLGGDPEPGEDVARPIVIRAARPHAAVIHGDEPLTQFTREPGYRYVYRAAAPAGLQHVVEADSDIVYEHAGSLVDVDEVVGAFLHDESAGVVYVHTSDSREPANHSLWGITQNSAGYSKMSPLDKPTRSFVIEGLVFKGFAAMALDLRYARHVTVRHCAFYHNCYGIYLCNVGRACRIEGNLVFANNVRRPGSPENAGIMLGGDLQDVVVDGNIARYNRFNNIRLYGVGSATMDVLFSNNRCYGQSPFWFKPAPPGCRMIGNVAEGFAGAHESSRNTLPYHTAEYAPQVGAGDLLFGRTEQERDSARFVDPISGDYRLQSDSPHRGKGPDGSDLGALPYRGDVFFVRPDGDDAAAGTSVAQAWKSLASAAARLQPGHTLYLMAGRYDEPLQISGQGDADRRITVRRRGTDRVVITGACVLDGARFVELDGLELHGGIRAASAANLSIRECLITGRGTAGVDLRQCRDVSLRHNTLAGHDVGLRVADAAGELELISNILQHNRQAQMVIDAQSVPAYYGNFNCWSGGLLAKVGRRDLASLSELRLILGERGESQQADARFVDAAAGDFRLALDSPCRGRGHLQRHIGPQAWLLPQVESEAAFEAVQVHHVGATGATLTWWTPRHPGYSLAQWQAVGQGESSSTLDLEFNRRIFHVVNLMGLKPDTQYELTPGLRHASEGWTTHAVRGWGQGDPLPAEQRTWTQPLRFRTLAQDPPGRTLHVRPDGDDAKDGLSRGSAWRTLRQACMQARAGDTVRVEPGRYAQTLAPFNSGAGEDRRITFIATEPRQAILDGNLHRIPWAVKLINRDYITVDGFTIQRQTGNDYSMAQTGASSAQVLIAQSRFCTLTRCYLDGGREFPNGSWAGISGVWLGNAQGARIDDNFLVKQTWSITSASGEAVGPDYVWPLIRNNTFLYTYIWTIHMVGGHDRLKLRNNLFAERVRAKAGLPYIRIWYVGSQIDSDYNFFYWNHDKPRDLSQSRVIMRHNVLPDSDPSLPGGLRAWQQFSGQDLHSLEGFFPTNNIYDNLDFTAAGKPYQGKGEGGADIGCTWIGKHTDQIVFEEGTPTVDIPPWLHQK
jgi:hypothetical protein